MSNRSGEKWGWTGGWLGGFLWVAILAVVFLFQGNWLPGLSGLLLVGTATGGVLWFAPWRHPTVPYWRLMLAPYTLFVLAIAWAVWAYGGLQATGIDGWFLLWFLPLMLPLLGPMAKRRWTDSAPLP